MALLKLKTKTVGVLLFALVAFLYFALFFLIRAPQFRVWMEAELGRKTGYEIKIGAIRLDPPLRIIASTVVVSTPDTAVFESDRITLGLTPLDPFLRRIHSLTLEGPVVRTDLDYLFQPSEKLLPDLSIHKLNIKDGEFVLKAGNGESFGLGSIQLSARDLKLGDITGALVSHAYLPWVDGDAEIQIQGPPESKEAAIRIRQRPSRPADGLSSKEHKTTGILQAKFTFKEGKNENYEVAATGTLHEFKFGSQSMTADFKSQLDLDSSLKNVAVFFRLHTSKLPAKVGPIELPLPEGPTTLTVRGDYSLGAKVFTMRQIEAVMPFASVVGKGKISLAEKPEVVYTTVQIQDILLKELTPFFPKILSDFTVGGVASVNAELSGPFSSPTITGLAQSEEVMVQGAGLHLSRFSIKLPFRFAETRLHIRGMSIRGREWTWDRKERGQLGLEEIGLEGELDKKLNGSFSMAGRFQIVQGRFSTPDGSKAGEKLTATGQFSLAHAPQDRRLPFEGKVEISGLNLLWGKFFGDFKKERPTIKVDGVYLLDKHELRLGEVNVGLRSIGNVRLKGVVQQFPEEVEFKLDVEAQDLRAPGFYDFFIRDTFKRGYPIWDKLKIGGTSDLFFHIQGSLKEFNVEGGVQLQEGEVREESEKWRLGPMEMILPFRLRYPDASSEQQRIEAPRGSLTVQKVTLGPMTIPSVEAVFSLWNNSLRFAQPILVSLYGGTVAINNLAWEDIVRSPKDLSFSVELKDLRLLSLTEALGWYRFGGKLSGSIPEVQWVGGALHSKGELTLEVFGGRVVVRALEVRDPFTSLPSIKMDVRLEEGDLEQATETFEFGRISGILEGTIEDLVITNGQAAGFRARLHSVKRRGVGQWISVEALNKITVLSSGNESGFLYGGLAKFFDSYRYSKLGVTAHLRNDRLILRGVEAKEGKEYLVVGTFLPPTVNIISHTHEVGFSELMRRLERIRKAEKAQ